METFMNTAQFEVTSLLKHCSCCWAESSAIKCCKVTEDTVLVKSVACNLYLAGHMKCLVMWPVVC